MAEHTINHRCGEQIAPHLDIYPTLYAKLTEYYHKCNELAIFQEVQEGIARDVGVTWVHSDCGFWTLSHSITDGKKLAPVQKRAQLLGV